MQTKYLYAIIAILIIVIAAIGGMWAWQNSQGPTTPPAVTLEFWAPFAGQTETLDFFNNVSAAFKNETGITVTPSFYTGEDYWTRVSSALAAGSPPDIFVTYPGGELDTYVNESAVADISDLYAEGWAQAQITPGVKDIVTRNGKQYALPYELHTDHIFINTKVFEANGVTIPNWQTSWTWDQFLAACQTFAANDVTAVAMSAGDTWSLTFPECYIFLRLNGVNDFKNALNRTISFASPYTAAFQKIQQWANASPSYFQLGWETQRYMDAYALFSSGKAAMWIQGTWAVGMTPDSENMTLDVIPFPYFPSESEAKNVVFGQTTDYSVANGSKHQTEAKSFLRFLSKSEWQIVYARTTSNPLAQNIVLPPGVFPAVMDKVLTAVASAPLVHIRFGTMCPSTLGSLIDEQNLLVFTGQTTPQAAAAAIEQKAVQVIGPVQP
jgi:ABC-type glycerol-3-phosphate transport system substrate-binding protein